MAASDAIVPDADPDTPCDQETDHSFLTIAEDTTFRRACSPYHILGALTVQGGATLTLEAGVEVRFGEAGVFMIGQPGSPGALRALGTAERPVVLDAMDDAAGPWAGLRFEPEAEASVVQQVHLRRCGAAPEACLVARGLAAQVTVADLTVAEAGIGLRIDDQPIGPLSGLVFTDVAVGLEVDARQVGAIDAAFDYGPDTVNHIVAAPGGDLTADATWIAQGAPWILRGDLVVQAADEADPPPILTLEAGFAMQVEPEGHLRIGPERPGGLVVHGIPDVPVSIGPLSAEDPEPFVGLVFGPGTRGSTIERLHMSFGGFEARVDGGQGCITVDLGADASAELSVIDSTFDRCVQAGIGSPRAGDDFAFAALRGNTFREMPLGVRARPNHLRAFADDQIYDRVPANAIVGGVDDRAPARLSVGATWAVQPVPFVMPHGLEVAADLEIEGPNTFAFAPETLLAVAEDGPAHLIVNGAADRPVTLRSTEDAAGGWHGVVFYPQTRASTALTGLIVTDGGAPMGNVVRGCVTVRGEGTGPIALVDSHITRCEQAGLAAIDGGHVFGSLAGLTLEGMPVGLYLHPSTVGDVQAALGYAGVETNRVTPGAVTADATWIGQAVPWRLTANGNAPIIEVQAALTLTAGLTLTLPRNRPRAAALAVGDDAPGQLIARGEQGDPVVFRSAEETPEAGDWAGLAFGPRTAAGTRLEWVRIEHAGHQQQAAIALVGTGDTVTVQSPRFADLAGPAIGCDADSTPTLVDVPPEVGVIGCP